MYKCFLCNLSELVEEHQVEIETIKADYDEQHAEFKVSTVTVMWLLLVKTKVMGKVSRDIKVLF